MGLHPGAVSSYCPCQNCYKRPPSASKLHDLCRPRRSTLILQLCDVTTLDGLLVSYFEQYEAVWLPTTATSFWQQRRMPLENACPSFSRKGRRLLEHSHCGDSLLAEAQGVACLRGCGLAPPMGRKCLVGHC
eukprot:1455958-Amphidinium_carterae.5